MERRVVITGMGAVTPLGNNAKDFWEGIKAGKNGIARITHFDPEVQKAKNGAEVRDFVFYDKKEAKRSDLYSQYGVTAALEAMEDSGLISGENIDPDRLSVLVGSGIGGIMTLEEEVRKATEKGTVARVSPFLVTSVIGNILAGNIAIACQAMGSCIGIVTACATGTQAIGEAFRSIQHGYTDAVIAGASEAPFAPVCFSGFANMTALSTREDPDRCSTPFDKERDGFVMGEGSGVVILEEYERAVARGARIYAEVVGYGSTCDAHHITMPAPDGAGAAKAMEQAIAVAGISPEEVSYINAHGTSTPYNDLFETRAIKKVFGDAAYKIPVSSTKSMIGHLLGAAGVVEAIICVNALVDGVIPPTINYKVPDEELDLDYVPNTARKQELTYAMSNSFGFGGHNGVILLKRAEK
ncbi:MAG TPA: beta-ketoacyl-ACP synthase II [Anaerovoracaceae bacterium]|nr:beta-ketoacyl-ACP synthase II [Anaerovoracaceae bacterium]